MAQRKTYRSLVYKDLDTYVMVNGVKTLVTFRGGSLQPPINGIFVASDPDLIRAMDKDSSNGISFTCVNVSGTPDQPKGKVEPKAEKTVVEKEVKVEVPGEKLQVTGIKTIQEAKEFLLANVGGLKAAQMPNGKAILNQAAKNGFEFPELTV